MYRSLHCRALLLASLAVLAALPARAVGAETELQQLERRLLSSPVIHAEPGFRARVFRVEGFHSDRLGLEGLRLRGFRGPLEFPANRPHGCLSLKT